MLCNGQDNRPRVNKAAVKKAVAVRRQALGRKAFALLASSGFHCAREVAAIHDTTFWKNCDV